jgi:hypothetical protein
MAQSVATAGEVGVVSADGAADVGADVGVLAARGFSAVCRRGSDSVRTW